MERITKYGMTNSDGGKSLGLKVCGVTVLITPSGDQQSAAEALAEAISKLGPADIERPPVAPTKLAPEPTIEPARKRREFVVGQRVRCNVHGAENFHTITEVGSGRHYGSVKVSGVRSWCPITNFDAVDD